MYANVLFCHLGSKSRCWFTSMVKTEWISALTIFVLLENKSILLFCSGNSDLMFHCDSSNFDNLTLLALY